MVHGCECMFVKVLLVPLGGSMSKASLSLGAPAEMSKSEVTL